MGVHPAVLLFFSGYHSKFVDAGGIGCPGDIGIKAVHAESVGHKFPFDIFQGRENIFQ